MQQLREAFPWEGALPFFLCDRDSIFSAEVTATIRNLGIEPVRAAYRSPWTNAFAERWIGSCRRELLDHVIVLGERHLRRLLAEYVAYYNAERVHTSLEDSPAGRATENRPSPRQGSSRSLAWAASIIATHGAKQPDSVALGRAEARDEY